MKILVAVKRVPDYQAKIKIAPYGSDIVTDGIKWIVNPFCEIAVEEAIRLKEQGVASNITVMTVGPDDAQAQLRHCLAMGADDAILVKEDAATKSDSLVAAKSIAKVYEKGDYQLILMGKQSIDSDRNQAAQMVAELLSLPQACFASKLTLQEGGLLVDREVDGGIERVLVKLPAVISTDLRLNEPRYAALPNIMKAKKKPLEILQLNEIVSDVVSKIKLLKLDPPPTRKAGKRVASVTELVELLKSEAKVL